MKHYQSLKPVTLMSCNVCFFLPEGERFKHVLSKIKIDEKANTITGKLNAKLLVKSGVEFFTDQKFSKSQITNLINLDEKPEITEDGDGSQQAYKASKKLKDKFKTYEDYEAFHKSKTINGPTV